VSWAKCQTDKIPEEDKKYKWRPIKLPICDMLMYPTFIGSKLKQIGFVLVLVLKKNKQFDLF
jgi:hypothetical protein